MVKRKRKCNSAELVASILKESDILLAKTLMPHSNPVTPTDIFIACLKKSNFKELPDDKAEKKKA